MFFEQVIEFANTFQRIHKFYIDWDKKLSETTLSSFQSSCTPESLCAQRAEVEAIRQAALQTPAALLRILHQLGKDVFRIEESFATVLVKEGTRKVAGTNGQNDWKISFHFVFQVPCFFAEHSLKFSKLTFMHVFYMADSSHH